MAIEEIEYGRERSAYFVNLSRGPIVDEPALIDTLRRGVIAGAGIDVFEQDPVANDNPLLAVDNVLLAPHALCWTDECFDAIAREGLTCMVDFANGRRPKSVVTGSGVAPDSATALGVTRLLKVHI